VYVDLLTGEVTDLKPVKKNPRLLRNISVPDYPILIADRQLIEFMP